MVLLVVWWSCHYFGHHRHHPVVAAVGSEGVEGVGAAMQNKKKGNILVKTSKKGIVGGDGFLSHCIASLDLSH